MKRAPIVPEKAWSRGLFWLFIAGLCLVPLDMVRAEEAAPPPKLNPYTGNAEAIEQG